MDPIKEIERLVEVCERYCAGRNDLDYAMMGSILADAKEAVNKIKQHYADSANKQTQEKHFFVASLEDQNFCDRCGQYITDQCHKRYDDDIKARSKQNE